MSASADGQRILVVDDEPQIVRALKVILRGAGYSTEQAESKEEALNAVSVHPPDAMVLDLVLPDGSGVDVCTEVRTWTSLPIIVLSAVGDEREKVRALDAGADDYITKPFGFMELMARVEALLRRTAGGARHAEIYGFGDVAVDFRKAELRKRGELIEVTARELKLLEFFIAHRGEVVPRERLLDQVWEYVSAPLTRTVDMHVAKLRKKIEDDPADPRFIVTVHRMGYKFTG